MKHLTNKQFVTDTDTKQAVSLFMPKYRTWNHTA